MFEFRLVGTDGATVEPQTFTSSIPSWNAGDQVFIRPDLAYRVVRVQEAPDDDQVVLVVERE
jgi:hypothetical protein